MPHAVTTVDKYQGQQNDYVLVSLVRTNSIVGHIRDIRRLIVAVSRARFGLYIFGRRRLFENCLELKNIFNILLHNKSSNLTLVKDEHFNSMNRKCGDNVDHDSILEIKDISELGLIVYNMGKSAIEVIKVNQDKMMLEVSQTKRDNTSDVDRDSVPIVFEDVDKNDNQMDVDESDSSSSESSNEE
jgi:intron-binding protein aquarius